MTAPPVVLDLQGAQSVDHRDRGVARFVLEHARAIERVAPGTVVEFALNPRLPPPGGIEDLIATGRVTSHVRPPPPGAIVHLLSPFELSIPLADAFPEERRGFGLAVTLYDLIPDILADRYLLDPGLRRRWRTRAELVRRSEAVLAISRSTAKDAMERLGLSAERVSVIGTGTAPQFRPPVDREETREQVRRRVPGLGSRWVLYTGGTDERKNVERLLEAWSLLPAALRNEWQLVIACSMDELQRNHLLVRADQLGYAGGLLVPGFVEEDVLVMLNQAADLAVYPSLYEGYGLPVAEALACGTPAVASNTSSLPELLPPEGLFDPTDPGAIASTVDAALRDPARRETLLAVAGRPPQVWDDVARRTLDAYRALDGRRRPTRPRTRRARRVAFVTPLPPQVTGVAHFSHRLLGELARLDDATVVDAYVDGPPHARTAIVGALAPEGVTARPLAALERVESIEGRYDEVVVSIGNSEFHTGGLALLSRRRAVVLAHDVVLHNLYHFAQWQHPAAVPGGVGATLRAMYGAMLPAGIADADAVDPDLVQRWGLAMARGAIAASSRYLVTSSFAASWARLDAGPALAHRVGVLPFPVGTVALPGPPVPVGQRPQPAVIASFGLVNATKSPEVIVRAFAALRDTAARLVFVGPCAGDQGRELRRLADELGVGHHLELTGPVDEARYAEWMQQASVAVQLRDGSNGESSAAVGDCLAAGIPTVVSAVGSSRDLPDEAAVKLDRNDPVALATVLDGLLADRERRKALQEGALAHAEAHTFRRTAEALHEELQAVRRTAPAAVG